MYRVDKRIHKHKRARRVLILSITLAVIVGLIYGLFHLRIEPEQNIHNAAPLSKKFDTGNSKKVTVDKAEFMMFLPEGWTENKPWPGVYAPTYSYRSPTNDSQLIELYFGDVSPKFAVNKALVVASQGDGLSYDVVSENCTTFTDAKKANQNGELLAKWQGVDFYCDIVNSSRAVVGTISKDAINQVQVRGPKTGQQKLFIVYTDNHITPDYSTLYTILGSIRFK